MPLIVVPLSFLCCSLVVTAVRLSLARRMLPFSGAMVTYPPLSRVSARRSRRAIVIGALLVECGLVLLAVAHAAGFGPLPGLVAVITGCDVVSVAIVVRVSQRRVGIPCHHPSVYVREAQRADAPLSDATLAAAARDVVSGAESLLAEAARRQPPTGGSKA